MGHSTGYFLSSIQLVILGTDLLTLLAMSKCFVSSGECSRHTYFSLHTKNKLTIPRLELLSGTPVVQNLFYSLSLADPILRSQLSQGSLHSLQIPFVSLKSSNCRHHSGKHAILGSDFWANLKRQSSAATISS